MENKEQKMDIELPVEVAPGIYTNLQLILIPQPSLLLISFRFCQVFQRHKFALVQYFLLNMQRDFFMH